MWYGLSVRSLSVLFVMAMANYAFAQERSVPSGAWATQTPRVHHFTLVPGFGPQTIVPSRTPPLSGSALTLTGVLPPTAFLARTLVTPARLGVCSVPLLEAQIPKDIQFTIRQVAPRMDDLAPMPQAKVPAPACDSR